MDIIRIIVEEVKKFLNEYEKIYTIRDLAELVTRLSPDEYDYNMMLKILQDMYQSGGDEFVVDTFHEMTHLNIYPISKGKYTFTEPVDSSRY